MKDQYPPNYSSSLLILRRLPARLASEQVAVLSGFQTHDIPVLVKAGLLKPLGGGPRNSVKYFASIDVEQKCNDPKWLDKATKIISQCRRPSKKAQREFTDEEAKL